MAIKIPLYGVHGRGKFTLVDDADYELVSEISWQLSGHGYVVAKSNKLILHRLLLEPAPSMWVDHINHDRLDNRRENIRIVTAQQNIHNNRPFAASGFKGVYFYQNKYHARITAQGKGYYLGGFKDPEEAARAYNAAAIEHFGDYAYLNPVKEIFA